MEGSKRVHCVVLSRIYGDIRRAEEDPRLDLAVEINLGTIARPTWAVRNIAHNGGEGDIYAVDTGELVRRYKYALNRADSLKAILEIAGYDYLVASCRSGEVAISLIRNGYLVDAGRQGSLRLRFLKPLRKTCRDVFPCAVL